MTNKVQDLAGRAALLILRPLDRHLNTGVIVSKQLIIALSLSVLVTACGGGGGGTTPQQPSAGGGGSSGGGSTTDPCGNTAQIEFVKEVSESYYYWYDELAQVNESDYDDASDYLAAIMQPIWTDGSGRDPGFSYLTTIEDDEARFTSGAYFGYGVRYRIINDNFYFCLLYTSPSPRDRG